MPLDVEVKFPLTELKTISMQPDYVLLIIYAKLLAKLPFHAANQC